MPQAAALGAAAGAGWGVLARIWMRLITSDPEFSWTGTLAIIGLAALLGSGVGLVAASKRAGRSLWWTLAVVPGLALFLSPGMLLAPSFLIGSLTFARRGRIIRAVGWAGIAVSIVGSTLLVTLEPEPGSETTPDQLITFVTGFTLLAITLAWAGSRLWRPRTPRTPAMDEPGRLSAPRAPGSGHPHARSCEELSMTNYAFMYRLGLTPWERFGQAAGNRVVSTTGGAALDVRRGTPTCSLGPARRRDDRAAHLACSRPARTGPDASHVHQSHPRRRPAQPIDTPTACTERCRHQGPPAAPRPGSARALTPSPYRRARRPVEGKKKSRPRLLTGPAPSRMTWGFTLKRGQCAGSGHPGAMSHDIPE